MKGVVFTEFLEMVEKDFSPEMVDDILDCVQLESGGVYTAVGTYDHKELVAIVVELSQRTKMEVPVLLKAFGKHLFHTFVAGYAQFFEGVPDAFTLLERVDSHIHIEVRKLYPDAELPKFSTRRLSNGDFEMNYVSARHFEDLAFGLLDACIEHFTNPISIEMTRTTEGALFLLKPKTGTSSHV